MKLDNVFCIKLLSHHRPKEQMAGVTCCAWAGGTAEFLELHTSQKLHCHTLFLMIGFFYHDINTPLNLDILGIY